MLAPLFFREPAPSRPTWLPGTLALACLLSSAGCASEAPSGPTVAVRDSAGITIVENHQLGVPAPPLWDLSPEPLVEIGSQDGPAEEQLVRVRGVLRLPDGRIAVGDAGSNQVRIFGGDGSPQGTLGGEGEGPGEFSFVRLAGRYGDSLVVVDRRLRRVSILHPDDGFVRSFTPDPALGDYLLDAWVLATGRLLLEDLPSGEAEAISDEPQRSPVPLRIGDLSGALVRDLGLFPGADQVERTRRTPMGLASVLLPLPFGRAPQVAVGGERMYFGAQDSYEIQVFDGGGSLLRIVRVDRPAVGVTEADLERFIAWETRDLAGDEARERRRELEGMPHTDLLPAHGRVHADAQGYLFVEDYRVTGEGAALLDIFDPEGRLAGRLHLPEGLQIQEIGADYVLGLVQDSLGVEYVRLHRLHRPGE